MLFTHLADSTSSCLHNLLEGTQASSQLACHGCDSAAQGLVVCEDGALRIEMCCVGGLYAHDFLFEDGVARSEL
jgi:hypothetical protein